MIWAALGSLMQTSLRSGYDLFDDICPDHIDICADHCRSLVLAHRCHGPSIWCPAFGSNSEKASHSRATNCPDTTIPMEERRQLSWLHFQQKRSKRSLSEQIKKDRIVSRPVWNILNNIDRIKREWMDGWNIFLRRRDSNIEGYSLASRAHPHWLSGNNPNLVLYGGGLYGGWVVVGVGGGVQRRLIVGRSALVGVG